MESHKKLELFFGCFFLLLMGSSADGASNKQRCTFHFRNDASVDVKCEEGEKLKKTYGQLTFAPIEVISGLWLFGDPLGNGQRSLIAVENTEIELHDIHFTEDLGNKLCFDV